MGLQDKFHSPLKWNRSFCAASLNMDSRSTADGRHLLLVGGRRDGAVVQRQLRGRQAVAVPRPAVGWNGNDDDSNAVHFKLSERMDLHRADEEVLSGTEF